MSVASRKSSEHDAALWRTLDPARTATWTVRQPSTGTTRTLTCRFVDGSDAASHSATSEARPRESHITAATHDEVTDL